MVRARARAGAVGERAVCPPVLCMGAAMVHKCHPRACASHCAPPRRKRTEAQVASQQMMMCSLCSV